MGDSIINITTDNDSNDFGDFMKSIEDSMLNLVKKSAQVPKDFRENWEAFSAAINWQERLFMALLVFHLVLYLLAFITRNHVDLQTFLFIFISGFLFFSERINTWCRANWREIASQNYFDESGVFAGIFFAAPLLLLLFLQLINFLATASTTLVKVKRLQLAQQRNLEKSKEQKSD